MRSENRIFVDAARVIGKVEPDIYGFNVEHIHHDKYVAYSIQYHMELVLPDARSGRLSLERKAAI